MILKDGMLLFHGSYTPIEEISLDQCTYGKDFGRGFYLTSDVNQAKRFIKTSVNKAIAFGLIDPGRNYGYVSSFRYHKPEQDISSYTFEKADKEWLWFVSMNRRRQLAEVLAGKTNPQIAKSDIIIGKIANDTTNPVITTYLNGLYGDILSEKAIKIAIDQLMPEHLIDQYCFLTQRAIDCVEFQEARKYDI